MTDSTPHDPSTSNDEETVTFNVKSNQAKWTLTLPLSTTAIDLKNKLAASEYANVPAASQRLIYSGRVLKDDDTLLSHKVKDGNTMHLVKSAPSNQRQNPASQSASGAAVPPTSTPQVPQNIAAGTGNDPFAALTGARYAGFSQLPSADMFGADGGMGPPPSIESMTEMLSNPSFAQMMNEALQNPQLVDMMIQQNPQLRAMGPQARQMLQSDQFRQMITNPQALQQMAQLSRMMGTGPFGGGAGEPAFPMPGATTTTPAESRDTGATPNTATAGAALPNPFAALMGGGGGGGANPFAALVNPTQQPSSTPQGAPSPPTGTSGSQNAPNPFAMLFNPAMTGQGANPSNDSTNPPPNPFLNNPFLQDPASMATLMRAMGGAGAGAGAGAGSELNTNHMQNLMNMMGGAAAPPADSRPPEERYATQLRQLNEMGFYEFERNIQALTRSGGDVNGALEWLFSQPS